MPLRGSRISVVALLLLVFGAVAGCSVNPATGRTQFNILSTSTEINMGLEAKPQVTEQYGGEVKDPALQKYVTGIGMKLASFTEGEGPSYPWSFTVLDSDVVNAFALPGGQVFITRGLLGRLSNEAQLAGVLGHEIGHAVAQHGDEKISRQLILAGVVAGTAVATSNSDDKAVKEGVPLLVGAAGQGFLLSYDRSQELEADMLGVRYMVKAGYNPMGQIQVMKVLASLSSVRQPEILSTHPHPEKRVTKLEKLIHDKYAFTQNNPNYGFYEERFRRSVPAYIFDIKEPGN